MVAELYHERTSAPALPTRSQWQAQLDELQKVKRQRDFFYERRNQLEAEVIELRARLIALGAGGGWVTLQEAARRAGVSIASASRYCASGYWKSECFNNRIFVDASQPLQSKRDAGRARRQESNRAARATPNRKTR